MKRLIIFFSFLFLIIPLFSSPVFAGFLDADANSAGQNIDDARIDPNLEGSAIQMMNSQLIYLSGCSVGLVTKTCGLDPSLQSQYRNNSVLGTVSNTIAMMYDNPPADLAFWFKDTGESLGLLPKSTYAQGVGFNGLRPLLPLWKIFRNIAYLLLAIMMVFVGFMVMFRRKIDPKTVVTVQNALPRVIVALIAITFSYAIVAFLIEIMYVVMFMFTSLLRSSINGLSLDQSINSYVSGSPGTLWANLFGSIPNSIGLTNDPMKDPIGFMLNIVNNLGDMLQSVVLWVVFAIALLFTFFRLFFMLISAYIGVIVSVIIGPIQILADVIPGTNALQNWLVGIVGNLSTFALTGILLMINRVVVDNVGTQNLWAAPYMGQMSGTLLKAIIGCGMMIMIPNLVNSLKQAIKANAVVPLSVGSALAPVTGTVGNSLNIAFQASHINSLWGSIRNRGGGGGGSHHKPSGGP